MKLRRTFLFTILVMLVLSTSFGCVISKPQGNVVTVLAGSELKDLEPMLDQIQQMTGIRLKMEYSGTLNGAEKLIAGEKYDLAWFSHAKYLNLLEGAKSRVLAQEKIMLSPVVLGVKESRARSWGWVDNPALTWRDVMEKAGSGELHYAMTNPSSSNTGFSALVGVAAAISGKGDALQKDDITRINVSLKEFFKGQALTAGSSGWLADQYVLEQDRLDGMINYESVLLGLNISGKLKEKLYLIYPKEGIITADYPLLLISEDKRDDYKKLVDYLRSPDFQREIMTRTLRRPVNSQVSQGDAFPKQLLIELPFPNSREVVDQLLFSYLDEQVKPSHTYYVLDVSGSMSGERLDNLKLAMQNLAGSDTSLTGQFARFRNREKVTILAFSDHLVSQSDFEVITSQPESFQQIRDHVQALQASGKTAIYTSLQTAYTQAIQDRKTDPDRVYSIVLMSDGESNTGSSESDFLSFYQSTPDVQGIRTFTILFGEANARAMQTIAQTTGGKMFDAGKDALSLVFKEIRGYQ